MRMPVHTDIRPDRWVLVDIAITTPDYDQLTCVLAGWDSGAVVDEWRLSTDIVHRHFADGVWTFDTASGSRYIVSASDYGLTDLTASILSELQAEVTRKDGTITLREAPTDA